MKTTTRLLLALLICASITSIFFYKRARAATTYTWNQTGTASWATAGNWTPTRTTPAADDVLVFNNGATTTVTNVPTQTIGQLSVSANTGVTLQPAAGVLTLTINGDAGTDLSVAAGSALNISGGTTTTNTLQILVATGATGSISGTMTYGGANHTLLAADAGGITFNSGASFTQGALCLGSVFTTTGTQNVISFASGASFISQAGSNPFGLGAGSSKVQFQAGSLFSHQQSGTPSFSGRTYPNFELKAAVTITVTGGSAVSIDNLTITQGTLNFNMTATPGHAIKGNISVASGATLNFNPASAGTLNLSGASPQTISNSGTLTAAANQSFVIPSASNVTLNSAFTLAGGMTVNAGGTLATAATYTNNGTTTINGTFQINQSGNAAGSNNFTYDQTVGTLTFNNSAGSFSVVGTPVFWPTSNGPQNVRVLGSGGITVNVPRSVANSFTYAAGVSSAVNLTLSGLVQINTGGFVSGSPTYLANTLLKYNTGGTYGRNGEWLPGVISGAGYPHHVQLSNNTTLDLPNSSGGSTFQMAGDLTIDAGSTMQLAGSTPLNQTLTIFGSVTNNGTLNLSTAPGGNVNVGGSWTNNATFNANGRTVNFNGSIGQTISGNSTFFNLTKNSAVPQTLTFAALSTQTVTNLLTLNGASGNLLSLRSSTPGTQWKLNAPATQSVNFVDVKDSDASGGTQVTTSSSVDSGNNLNWSFPASGETDVAVTGGNLVITDSNGGTTADTITISLNTTNVRINDPSQALAAGAGASQVDANTVDVPLASITSIQVNTLAGNDVLTLNFAGGNFLPASGLSYAGGAQTSTPGDRLAIVGGTQGTVTYNYTNAHDGSVVMSAYGTVSYTGLEPLSNSGSATDVIFNLPVGPNTITMEDDGVGANGMSRLRGVTIETTDFANPSNSLQIVRGNAADFLTINGPTDFTASMTLGAAGTEFTQINFQGTLALAANKNLAVFATGPIALLALTPNVSTSGTGTISLTTASNIIVGIAAISVVNGDMTLSANQQVAPTAGTFTGLTVEGTLTTSGSGKIILAGKGGANPANGNHVGILVDADGVISSTSALPGAGTITLNGTGGTGTTNGTGVFMDGTAGFGTINSVVGDIAITGQGTGTTVSNYGVNMQFGAVVSSTGIAKITIDGTPGNGTNANGGIRLINTGTQVKSTGGDILLTGHPGTTTGNGNRGVSVFNGALVSGSGPAKVKLDGTGSSGTNFNVGVEVAALGAASTPATVTSASEIQIIGHAGTGSSFAQIGVNIDAGAKVLATGSANLIIDGTGGTGSSDCYGVGFESGNVSGTTASAVNGNITITGVAGTNAGTDMDGVRFEDSVASQAVAISITGTGSLTVNGTAGNTGATSSGIQIVDDTTMSLTGANNAFNADTMDFGSSNTSINAGANAILLRGKTSGRNISLGAADSASELGLTDAELDIIAAATLNLGDTSSGIVKFFTPITRSAATNVNLASQQNIIFASSLDSGGGNVLLRTSASNFVDVSNSGVDVSMSTTGTLSFFNSTDLSIVINNASVDSGYTQLNVAGLINLNGADLVLSGAHVPTAGQQFIIVNNDAAEAITGTFNGLPEGATIPSFLGSALNATITYIGGDGNDAVILVAAAPAQEIAVEEPAGNDLNSGALRDFGNQAVGVTSAPKTFTIKNIGTANLNITNITKTGTHAADFSVTPDLTGAVITPSNSTTFNVTFTPGALSLRQAAIHINSNDVDESSFDINLQGTGVNPDYTITASALAVVVTDVSGNSDTLTVTEPAGGMIKFAAPGRFFSINGGLATSGDSGNIAIPSVTTITVNEGAGNDIYNMGAFSMTMPSLQINGGTGDDTVNLNGTLIFGATRMLDIDLQDDSATPGIDSVNIATNVGIFMTTTGTATIRASRNFTMASGSTLQVENGAMIIEANLQATPTSGNFNGVDVDGGSIFTVGTGNVVINGTGGAGNFIENVGVSVSGGGKIASTNTGTLAVQGTGGAGSGSATAGQGNIGVYLTGSGSTIKSATSATQITGIGGTTNDSNVVGVSADELATIETNGAGTLTINGTGGTVNGGSTTAVNSGGVFIVVGDVNGDGGEVKSTGTGVNAGNIIITGTATNGGAGSAQGVRVDGPASITTVDGHISITGTSAPSGNACLGVSIRGDVTATGNANITIDGTGGASTGAFPTHGVNVRANTLTLLNGKVATVNGDIAILATGGSSTGTDNAGFDIGTPAQGTLQTTGTGRIIINSDNIRINPAGTNANISAGANIVSLRQRTNGTAIDVGASAVVPAAGTLELSDLELDRVTAGQINIGNSNTGPIKFTQPITRAAATNINPTSSANIDITTGSINTGGGSFSPLPGTNFFPLRVGVDVNTGANTTLLSTALRIVISNTTVDTGYTQLNLVGVVNLNNAALQLSGSHVPLAGQQFIIVNNDSNDAIVGTFNGLPQGTIINNFLSAGVNAQINYTGGDGNDAVLTVLGCPSAFTVNSNLDAPDGAQGDGVCATAGSVCTLRAAIQEANANSACGPININFSIPTSTITVSSVLSITHSVNINGPVASSITVTGTAAAPTRVFLTNANTTVNISNLTVSGGRAGVGAGLMALGPNSTTTLNGMLFTGNIAIDPAGFAGGGGAASGNGGTLNIYNSTFSGNIGTHGGAISLQGGSPINLVNVTITNNLADGNTGSGPCPAGGSVDGNGGGIQGSSMPPTFLNIRNSIVAFNQDCNSNNPNLTDLVLDQGNNITFNDPSLNLGPLQNNGGPTLTYALQTFSTAIDAGNDCVFTNTCVPSLGVALTTDQRGPTFPRMVNGDTVPAAHVDIGAFEKQTPSASNSSISGRIVDSGGRPVEGAAIRLSGAQDRLTLTDKEGNYRFEEVATNGFYTVTPSRTNFTFTPEDRTFSQVGDHTDALFTANAMPGEFLNPLDSTEYFVRQQYLDFLNREPDEAGLSFWVNNINACGADAICRKAKRTDTSAAFFLSIEFHETGYLVYRAYQSAYGEIPGAPVPLNLAEFQPDTAMIGEDVIVNAPGWQAKLEANKQAYFAAFVARSRFSAAYPGALTPAEFVDRLFSNAGVTPTANDRAAAVAEFANGQDSSNPVARAHALRRVAENRELEQAKANRAFVLMQYFGYLGRDPNALPDGNFAGYDFWLHKLEEFGGDFRRAEMVKAFLVAGEYRGRFPR